MYEPQKKLRFKAEAVDLENLGVDSTWKHPDSLEMKSLSISDTGEEMVIYCNEELTKMGKYEKIKRCLVAQALIDGISNTEAGLSVRWALPSDLGRTDWYVPTGTFNNNRQKVFNNYHSNSYNRSVLLIWGVGRGYHSSAVVQTVVFKRANVKTIEVVSLSQCEKGRIAVLERPILYKRSDECEIDVELSENWEEKRDEIVLAGWVCEYLGATQTG